MLESLKMHHFFLQSVRVPIRFVYFFPASIFVFQLQKSDNPYLHFDFKDLPTNLAIAIQLGTVGIIAVLQDGGAQSKMFSSFFKSYRRYPLHPVQFLEMISIVFYRSTLFNRTPKYIIAEGKRSLQIMQLPLQGLSMKPVFDDWKEEHYAKALSFYTHQPVSSLFFPPDQVVSWLNGPKGKPRYLDLKLYPL